MEQALVGAKASRLLTACWKLPDAMVCTGEGWTDISCRSGPYMYKVLCSTSSVNSDQTELARSWNAECNLYSLFFFFKQFMMLAIKLWEHGRARRDEGTIDFCLNFVWFCFLFKPWMISMTHDLKHILLHCLNWNLGRNFQERRGTWNYNRSAVHSYL